MGYLKTGLGAILMQKPIVRLLINKLIMPFCFLFVVFQNSGCFSSGSEPIVDPNQPSHYTISRGTVQPNPYPLPDYTPVYLDWHLMGGGMNRTLAYQSWDFDKDGRLDMVEILRKDGSREAFVFDFDGDGHPDMIRRFE
jgi:hypothetical protein